MRHRIWFGFLLPTLRGLLALRPVCSGLWPRLRASRSARAAKAHCATHAPGKDRPFAPVSYDVFARFCRQPDAFRQSDRGIRSDEPSRTVECELHPNLTNQPAMRDAIGKLARADRGDRNELDVRISLPNRPPGEPSMKLTFDYSGPLANEENSPVAGVRLASIGKGWSLSLLPARWFPLTDYPPTDYTGVFHIEVPQNFAVVGTGTPGPRRRLAKRPAPSAMPSPDADNRTPDGGAPRLARRNQERSLPTSASNGSSRQRRLLLPARPRVRESRVTYTFRVDRPEAAGTFVAGALQLAPVKAEGLNISVYAPAERSRYGAGLRRSRRAHRRSLFRSVWTARAAQSHRGANSRRHAAEFLRARPVAGEPAGMAGRRPTRACSRIWWRRSGGATR